MEDKIGVVAGQIWKLLAEKGQVNINDIPKLTNQKSLIAYQGLGWLAREGKLCYETKGQQTVISLAMSDCCH